MISIFRVLTSRQRSRCKRIEREKKTNHKTLLRHAVTTMQRPDGLQSIQPACLPRAYEKHQWQTDIDPPNCPKCLAILQDEDPR